MTLAAEADVDGDEVMSVQAGSLLDGALVNARCLVVWPAVGT